MLIFQTKENNKERNSRENAKERNNGNSTI